VFNVEGLFLSRLLPLFPPDVPPKAQVASEFLYLKDFSSSRPLIPPTSLARCELAEW